MNLSKKLINSLSLATFVVGGVLGLSSNIISNSAYAVESAKIGGNGYQCLASDPNRWKTENDPSAVLPSGYSISSVVVKAGQNCVTVYPTNTADTCYSVVITNNTVTVDKIGSGKTCKDISHLEGTYTASTVTPTETPTPTPTDVVTPTPITCPVGHNLQNGICIVLDCPGQGTCEVVVDSIPTPTVTSTPTPTPGSSSSTSIVQAATGSSDDKKSENKNEPVKTMAPTGNFGSILSNISIALGLILSSSAAYYAKREKK